MCQLCKGHEPGLSSQSHRRYIELREQRYPGICIFMIDEHHPLRIGIVLGVVTKGRGLKDAHDPSMTLWILWCSAMCSTGW
jgi:hypothetical protein